MAWARMVAVVVPSPATVLVLKRAVDARVSRYGRNRPSISLSAKRASTQAFPLLPIAPMIGRGGS
jgi:hypothetical protein